MGKREIQGFFYYWMFPRVALNGDIMMWFMVSQEKRISAFQLLQYFLFKYVNRVGFL